MIGIVGASGFVGRATARALVARGAAVRALVRNEGRARAELAGSAVELHVVDVRDERTLRGRLDGCDIVVSTVAVPTERSQAFADVNVRGVTNVVAEARRAGVKRLVHLSAVNADPASRYPYLRSKGAGQAAVEAGGLPHVIVRPSLLFGPGDDFFPRLGFTLRFPLVPVPGDGRARFQPLHVDDLAQCLVAACERDDLVGTAYDVGGPDEVSYDDLLQEAMRGFGVRRPTLHLPVPLVKIPATLMGLVLSDPPVTVSQLDLLAVPNVPSPNRIERFGVSPRPFRGGLAYLRG